MRRKYATPLERIQANSVVSTTDFYEGTPCWDWTGKTRKNRTDDEYPAMNVWDPVEKKVKTIQAHRFVAKEINGRRLTRVTVVDHLCNRTICVSPDI